MLEGVVRSAIIQSVGFATRLKAPDAIDEHVARAAIGIIQLYRITLSPWLGRQCLFCPTCSQRALAYFRQSGWTSGIRLTHEQLSRCRGNFTLHLTPDDRVELVTIDGQIFPQEELAPRLLRTYEEGLQMAGARNSSS